MTFVLSTRSSETLWVVADRRLSWAGRPPRDDAIKVMALSTRDGTGLLGYSGLGATGGGMQPSEWMSNVLRGRAGLTFEQSLSAIMDAARARMPAHLTQLQAREHIIVASAWIYGEGARVYRLGLRVRPDGQIEYRFDRPVRTDIVGNPAAVGALTGSGGIYLGKSQTQWRPELHRLMRAHDRGQVSDRLIADALAKLSYRAHEAHPATVGPTCIVAWRHRPDGPRRGGGAHRFYQGLDQEEDHPGIPTIASDGFDMGALTRTWAAQMSELQDEPDDMAAVLRKMEEMIVKEVESLPSDPDDSLG